jgi:hypothetical protein
MDENLSNLRNNRVVIKCPMLRGLEVNTLRGLAFHFGNAEEEYPPIFAR